VQRLGRRVGEEVMIRGTRLAAIIDVESGHSGHIPELDEHTLLCFVSSCPVS
jgi:hypothetical protein